MKAPGTPGVWLCFSFFHLSAPAALAICWRPVLGRFIFFSGRGANMLVIANHRGQWRRAPGAMWTGRGGAEKGRVGGLRSYMVSGRGKGVPVSSKTSRNPWLIRVVAELGLMAQAHEPLVRVCLFHCTLMCSAISKARGTPRNTRGAPRTRLG